MSKITKITAGALVAMVIGAIAAFLWWSDDGPEAVDLEAAVAQMESAGLDDTADAAATEATIDIGTVSSTGPDSPVAESDSSGGGDAPTADTLAGTVTTSTETPGDESTDDNARDPDTSVPVSTAVVTDDEPPGETEGTSAESRADAFSGLWTLAMPENAEGLPGEPAVSFAGFRVVEVLAGGVAESTAVGRTAGVSGFIELAGYTLVAGAVEVEMATLRTDNSHRDSHMRQALNTREFPMAVFTLVEPVELPGGVFEGETFSASVQGDLTIKGVTNRASFGLKARLVGNTIVAVGSAGVVFSDYGVRAPYSASVIRVDEHGVMEFQLYFTR